MWLAWGIAGLIALLFAAALGLALLRLRGHYFAIASLVVAEVLREIINSATDLTGGGMGLNLPLRTGQSVEQQADFLLDHAGTRRDRHGGHACGSARPPRFRTALHPAERIRRRHAGCEHHRHQDVSLRAIRSVHRYRGGDLCLLGQLHRTPDVFDVLYSVKPIVMVLLGGAGSVFGPIIGAGVFLGLEEIVWRRFLEVHSGVLGLLIVLLVLFLPRGLAGIARRRARGHKP